MINSECSKCIWFFSLDRGLNESYGRILGEGKTLTTNCKTCMFQSQTSAGQVDFQ